MSSFPDPVLKNVRAIAALERAAVEQRGPIDRVTDAVSGIAGNPAFIVAHVLWFFVWIVINRNGDAAFDPLPFSLLNVLVSLEAIILMSFVLMTQNRMTKQADRRAHLDLQINLLAEQELTAMLHMLRGLCEHAGVTVTPGDARIEHLLQETDVQKLAVALEAELKTGPPSDAADDVPGEGRREIQ